jgi:hypothetical protein
VHAAVQKRKVETTLLLISMALLPNFSLSVTLIDFSDDELARLTLQASVAALVNTQSA